MATLEVSAWLLLLSGLVVLQQRITRVWNKVYLFRYDRNPQTSYAQPTPSIAMLPPTITPLLPPSIATPPPSMVVPPPSMGEIPPPSMSVLPPPIVPHTVSATNYSFLPQDQSLSNIPPPVSVMPLPPPVGMSIPPSLNGPSYQAYVPGMTPPPTLKLPTANLYTAFGIYRAKHRLLHYICQHCLLRLHCELCMLLNVNHLSLWNI